MDRRISGRLVHACLAGARRRGLDVGRALARSGIEPEARTVTTQQYARLVRHLWTALDDELLGFGPAPSRLGTFATMAALAVHGPDLRTALLRGAAFYDLFAIGVTIRLVERGREARLEFTLTGFPQPADHLVELVLGAWHRFASWLVGGGLELRRAEFPHGRPPYVLEYDAFYGCGCLFGRTRPAIGFDRAALDRPVLRDETALTPFLRRYPADLVERGDYSGDVAGQVRKVLAEGGPDLASTAARLAVSPAGLRHRLRAEGTSYQRVRDRFRRDAAVSALARGDLSIEELSRRLGFSEPSAFHRAFKRWTGTTPRAYRP
ncbi:AraC family transcriptional regulator [Nonomuraea endophytica]|uniref:AraC family transcriptional regulator n=1 Tax=Nonomuraea endophytica TaxID=714136 RepID=UPI0037C80C50